MKNFVIEQRVNPFDEFKKYKQFDTLEKAQQSIEMLKKHVHNLSKGSEYMKYRLYDVVNKNYYY
jgi:cell division protein FtsB